MKENKMKNIKAAITILIGACALNMNASVVDLPYNQTTVSTPAIEFQQSKRDDDPEPKPTPVVPESAALFPIIGLLVAVGATTYLRRKKTAIK